MTPQERAQRIVRKIYRKVECETHEPFACECHASEAVEAMEMSLAALEQDAITAYLAAVPLPEGWTEKRHGSGIYYSDEEGNERVVASREGAGVIPQPAHWPAIPQAVLVRAAVQCGRLREAGR